MGLGPGVPPLLCTLELAPVWTQGITSDTVPFTGGSGCYRPPKRSQLSADSDERGAEPRTQQVQGPEVLEVREEEKPRLPPLLERPFHFWLYSRSFADVPHPNTLISSAAVHAPLPRVSPGRTSLRGSFSQHLVTDHPRARGSALPLFLRGDQDSTCRAGPSTASACQRHWDISSTIFSCTPRRP